ncbi:carbohydrate kinase [Lysobacter korlensis]|uniref:Carbohydrate kinase n=1 Tax=Lysobacter korlensis TaxID=553636 RepID=A0ABV6RX89_9GAMM
MTSVPATDPPSVLVVGEALVDIVRAPDGDREFPGGSPLNVAFGLARLGIATTLQTRIGRDAHGERVRGHLGSAGVALWPGSEDAPRTSTAVARIGADGTASYEFDIRWDVEPIAVPPVFSAVHAGSIAAFLEPGATAVRRTLAGAAGSALVTFDPNIRPALVGARQSALAAFEETVGLAGVVKLSDEDAEWLYPGSDVDDVLARVLDLGADLAVCTLGAAGARLRTRAHAVNVPAVRVPVADTIGAGDSFMSCLLAELLQRDDPPRELDSAALSAVGAMAVRAAAITVGRPGAQPPTAAELGELL